MYSLVLAAMITTGTATPAWGCCGGGGLFHHGGHGCHGYHGAWGGYGGCYSCYGCLGCYGGAYGAYGGYGGYGGCWSCWGGGYGGYGGNGGYGGWGCYGGCFGCYGGCYGGWGGAGGYINYGGYGAPVAPSAPAMQGAPGSKEEIKTPPAPKPGTGTGSGSGMAPSRAQILVQLPTDAKLFVDDRLVTLPANQRTVVTPELDAGQDYYYIFRAEVVRNGTPVEDTRRVVIRAGARVTVDFGDLATAKAKTVNDSPLISAK
jgi:uncharacterized protein (TIGR03000 family)